MYLNEDLSTSLNLVIDMDYHQEYFTITIFNKQFKKKYMAGIYGPQMKGNIFDEHKAAKEKGSFGMTYYLYKNSKTLKIVSGELEELHKTYRFRNGFKISASAPVNEKVDRMSEYNRLLINETGSIARRL